MFDLLVLLLLARNAAKWRGRRFYVGGRNLAERSPRPLAVYDEEWRDAP